MTPLIGHGWVVDFLRKALGQGRAHHAYLLTGPAHIGKMATAQAMARVLLCERETGCRECRPCRLADRESHADLRILRLPADRKNIPIKDVHEFMDGIALKPLEGKRSVYIVDQADLLSEDGANAFLKTIEEPPTHVTLILTATDPARLLPTVVSRCQRIALRPAGLAAIAEGLIRVHGLDPQEADRIAQASHGLPGLAMLIAEDPSILDTQAKQVADLARLLGASRLERLQYADALAERWSGHQEEITSTLEVWIDAWRALVHAQTHGKPAGPAVQAEALAAPGAALSASSAEAGLKTTLDVLEGLQANAHPRLALETLLLTMPSAESRA